MPTPLPKMQGFHVKRGSNTCIVEFAPDSSKVGIALIRDLKTRMSELNARDGVLVASGLTHSAVTELRHMVISEGIYICAMTPESLQFDLTEHKAVPPHKLMTPDEREQLLKTYPAEVLPIISLDDPVSKYYGAHPGDVFEITRTRPNVGKHTYYRIVTIQKD